MRLYVITIVGAVPVVIMLGMIFAAIDVAAGYVSKQINDLLEPN